MTAAEKFLAEVKAPGAEPKVHHVVEYPAFERVCAQRDRLVAMVEAARNALIDVTWRTDCWNGERPGDTMEVLGAVAREAYLRLDRIAAESGGEGGVMRRMLDWQRRSRD